MYFALIGFGVIAALTGILIGLVIQILFLLNLWRLLEAVQPQNRAMSPGLVWLNLIPVFNLGWMIYTVLRIRDSVGNENASRGGAAVNERDTHTIGLVYAILAAAGFVLGFGGFANRGFSAFGGLVSLAVLILWIIYWMRTHRMRRELEMNAGRGYGPGGPYGPGGQYAPGGSYPGYGAGAAGYGAGYGAGSAAPPDAAPPVQPPVWTPPPREAAPTQAGGAESGRDCSQCGKELNPDDAFCSACGTQVTKE